MPPINFSIVIPNFNGLKALNECFASIYNACLKTDSSNFEIILVDNGSIDQSLEFFSDFSKKNTNNRIIFKTISLKKNTGFAFSVNRGINESVYPYVAVINNDLRLSPDWFNIITQNIKKSKLNTVTFFGTVLNRKGDKIESQGFQFFYSGKAINVGNNCSVHDSDFLSQKPSFIWGAPAAAIIYQKSIFKEIGYFEEDFFAYLEDVDLSFRLNKFGYKTLYIPQAVSFHTGGQTSNKMGNLRQYYSTRNWYLLILKNYQLSLIFKNFFPIASQRLRNFSWYLKSTPVCLLPYQTLKMLFEIIYLGIRLRYTKSNDNRY